MDDDRLVQKAHDQKGTQERDGMKIQCSSYETVMQYLNTKG